MSQRTFGVKVTLHRSSNDHVVDVDCALPSFAPTHAQQKLVSSQRFKRRLGAGWAPPVPDRVKQRRRRKGGARKGRLCYVLRDNIPAAILTYHVPDKGPLMITELFFSLDLDDPSVAILGEYLISCATEASQAIGRSAGVVGWATDSDDARTAATGIFGFVSAKKPLDCELKHYMLRG